MKEEKPLITGNLIDANVKMNHGSLTIKEETFYQESKSLVIQEELNVFDFNVTGYTEEKAHSRAKNTTP